MGNRKKKKKRKKKSGKKKKGLNTKLERHMARPHALPYEFSTFIYIYILTSKLPMQYIDKVIIFYVISFFGECYIYIL